MKKILILTVCSVGLLLAGNGKAIYETNCVSCHGQNAELRPLGKDEIIRGMSEKKIVKKLLKMKESNTLFNMFDQKKALMQEQAKKLNQNEILEVAKYITTL
ncbi:c-type cytochrome [Sulfurospirillum sp.]|nr:c-type cytochrome [Sulfurospirillum sp.]